MIRKLFTYTVSAVVLASLIQATPAFAEPGNVTQSQINATQGHVDDLETQVQQLDNRINLAIEKSQNLNDQIQTQQGEIEKSKVEIETAKNDLEAYKQAYSERLKSIQAEGKISVAAYAEVLLSSNNLSEFLTRFSAISQIIQNDTDKLNGLKEKQQALTDAEDKLQNELANLKKNQVALAAEQKQIEEDKAAVGQALGAAQTQLQDQQDQFAAQQEAARQAQIAAREEADRQARLAQQQQPAQVQQPSVKTASNPAPAPTVAAASPSDPDAANKVISYAKQFLGVPYVWGGSTPSGFDCSGFTSYVFRNAVGISLPRVSHDQQNVGTRISPSQVQPGDLVFRGNPAYHVGIYIGGGQYIHAPQTGDVVKISSYDPSKFSSASRVLR